MHYNADDLNVWERDSPLDTDNNEDTACNNRCLGPIIGIDLGTSNSCVSLWHTVKNRAKVVKNVSNKSKSHKSCIARISHYCTYKALSLDSTIDTSSPATLT